MIFPQKWQFRIKNEFFEIPRKSAYLWHIDIMKIILDVTVNLCFAIIFRIPVKMTQWCKSSSVKDLSKIRLPDWLKLQWETWRGFLTASSCLQWESNLLGRLFLFTGIIMKERHMWLSQKWHSVTCDTAINMTPVTLEKP